VNGQRTLIYRERQNSVKRPGKHPIAVLLIIAIITVAALGTHFFYRARRSIDIGKYETVERFPFSSAGEMNEWKEKILSRHGTDYALAEHDGVSCVKAVSEDSASAFFHKKRLSYARAPFISWSWRVEEFPSANKEGNLNDKEQFDFAAQVYVVFHARFLPKARAIQYVWTRDVSSGTVADSPYTKNVKIMVLESAEAGFWKNEKRDISKDYYKLFGKKLEKM